MIFYNENTCERCVSTSATVRNQQTVLCEAVTKNILHVDLDYSKIAINSIVCTSYTCHFIFINFLSDARTYGTFYEIKWLAWSSFERAGDAWCTAQPKEQIVEYKNQWCLIQICILINFESLVLDKILRSQIITEIFVSERTSSLWDMASY